MRRLPALVIALVCVAVAGAVYHGSRWRSRAAQNRAAPRDLDRHLVAVIDDAYHIAHGYLGPTDRKPDVDAVRALLAQGADPNGKLRKLPLLVAAAGFPGGKECDEIVRLLVEAGADVNATFNRRSVLFHAAYHRSAEIVELLIQHGADVHANGGFGTPLNAAAQSGQVEVMEVLLSHGADLESENHLGGSPLLAAATEGHLPAVELLIAEGADVNAVDQCGGWALAAACVKGHSEVVECLLSHGAQIVLAGKRWTPLHCAAKHNHEKCARALLDYGADVNASDECDNTPLHYACGERSSTRQKDGNIMFFPDFPWHDDRDAGIAKLLLDGGAEINMRNALRNTPLHAAAEKGASRIARVLVENGADIQAKGYRGNTPLHLAAGHRIVGHTFGSEMEMEGRYEEIVRLLLAKGADVNATNAGGETPLDSAEAKGYQRVADCLRKHGGKRGKELR